MEACTDAVDVALLESEMTVPPVLAGPFRVTVPVDATPPTTVVGLRVRDARAKGFRVRVAV